jgi:Protein of unknown function (DUF1207)
MALKGLSIWSCIGCSLYVFSACAVEAEGEIDFLQKPQMQYSPYEVSFLDASLFDPPLAVEPEEINEIPPKAKEEKKPVAYTPSLLMRGETMPVENFESATDPYLEGYIQALLDMHYYEYRVIVTVKDHRVYLSHLPKNALLANSIIEFVRDLPGVREVSVSDNISQQEMEARQKYVEQPRVDGVWFPQATVLFAPLVADPREPTYSAALRFGDKVIGQIVAAVSLGDDFPIFRWRNVFRWHGDLQIGINAGVWAVFNYWHVPHIDPSSCELVNTDYAVGIPLTYAVDKWSFRFRIYHISSHLGDEFLVNHPYYITHRKNPSMEAIDFFTSYQCSRYVRLYFGPGVVFHSDKTFKIKPLYVEYGMELRAFGQKFYYHRLYGNPFFAVHFENWQQRFWHLDLTLKLGYELSKLQGVGRKMRIYVDYHHGYSYEGQFFNERTEYGEFGFSWGF